MPTAGNISDSIIISRSAIIDGVSIVEETTLSERIIRAATVHHRPSGTSSPQESVDQFSRLVRAGARLRPDLICLPEGITLVGNGSTYVQAAESIPGPLSVTATTTRSSARFAVTPTRPPVLTASKQDQRRWTPG